MTQRPNTPESNRSPHFTQQPLPSFENVLAFPRQYADESWPEFVARVQGWDRERTKAAQLSGAYRAVPYVPGLTDAAHRGLFVTLAWHSWSEGLGQYAPIRLSERCLAALMGDTSSHAKGRAGAAMKALIAAGGLEVLEEARGSRARLVRVACVCPSNSTKNKSTKGASPGSHIKRENKEKIQPSVQPEVAPTHASEHDELAAAVEAKFKGDISKSTVLAWIASTSAENVANQLRWFSQRDVSGFRRGPAAAFGYFCKSCEGEPVSEKRVRLEAEWQQKIKENMERQLEETCRFHVES